MVKKKFVPSTIVPAPSLEDTLKDVHGAIERALEARSEYVTQEAATMTLMRARRILEKDLNVEQGYLDPYKDFVRDLINKLLLGSEAVTPKSQKTEELNDDHDKSKEHEVECFANLKPEMKRLKKKIDSEGIKNEIVKDQIDDAGVSSTEKWTQKPGMDSSSDAKDGEGMESLIWEAARTRLFYFKSQAQSLTILGVRRLLEQDLGLQEGDLDAHKQHIRMVLDQLFNTEKEKEDPFAATNPTKTKSAACESKIKFSKSGRKRKLASSDVVEEDASHEEAVNNNLKPSKGSNCKRTKKVVKKEEEISGDNDDDGEPNGKENSIAEESDNDETERKALQVESKPAYSWKVEHLKSTIKACGITVPPNVYKKAKQSTEERREAVLIKELEVILFNEGLTARASKDDIKAVRKRKEKLKDLEGIDTSNIILESSRGRLRRAASSANNLFAPKRSQPVDLSDDDDEQDSDSENDPNVELQDDDNDDED